MEAKTCDCRHCCLVPLCGIVPVVSGRFRRNLAWLIPTIRSTTSSPSPTISRSTLLYARFYWPLIQMLPGHRYYPTRDEHQRALDAHEWWTSGIRPADQRRT